jgi:hypothetical protein
MQKCKCELLAKLAAAQGLAHWLNLADAMMDERSSTILFGNISHRDLFVAWVGVCSLGCFGGAKVEW